MRNKMIKTAESAVWQNQAGMQASLPRRVCIRRVFRVPPQSDTQGHCNLMLITREILDNPMNDSSPYFIQYKDFPLFADFYPINNIYQKSDPR